MLNRRQFIQSLLAAAAAAHLPYSTAKAEALYGQLDHGIEDQGNGWFRVWITRRQSQEERTFSCYAKAGDHNFIAMQLDRFRVWFDLESGEVGSAEVVDRSELRADMRSGYIWGAQVEEGVVH